MNLLRSFLIVAALAVPLRAAAIEVGSSSAHLPGSDATETPAGAYGTPQIGWDAVPPGNVGSVNGSTSGNAIVLSGVTDQVVQEAEVFTVSWGPACGGASGTATLDVTNVTTVSGYCALVHAHGSLTCNVRPEGVQITTPFCTAVTSFSFTHGAVAGRESSITITGLTDDSAVSVNRFQLRLDGVLQTAPAGTFAGVTSIAELATALDALPFVKATTVTTTSIQISANDFGAKNLSETKLDHFVPAVSPQVTFTGLSDADAALVDRVRLERNGVSVSLTGVDLGAANDLQTLADQLDISPDLSAQKAGGAIVVTLLPAGAGTVTHASLHVLPSLAGGLSTVAYTEGQTVILDPTLTVSQPTAAVLQSARVEVSSGRVDGEDVLEVTSPGALLVSTDATTGAVVLTGPGTAAEFESALRSATYRNSSENPSPDLRTVQFTVTDADDSSALEFTLAPTPVNDAPTLGTSGAALVYAENQAATAVDDALTLVDVDDAMLASAVVKITSGFAPAEDTLGYMGGGAINGSWDPSSATLTLTGPATVEEFEVALRAVTYVNSVEAPSDADREITFWASDALLTSAPAIRTLQVAPVDDPLVLTLTPTALSYEENGEVAVDDGLSITDIDGLGLIGATVSLAQGHVSAEDELGFTDQNGISGSWDAANSVLTLSGAASALSYRDALRSVTYRNLSENPSTATRTLAVTVSAGDSDTVVQGRLLTVIPVNDPPTLSASTEPLTSDGTSPTVLFASLEITDPDDLELTGATVRISNGAIAEEDKLSFTANGNVTSSWDSALSRLTLSGNASLAEYRSILASVAYENPASTRTPGNREFSVQVQDGDSASNIATVQLTLSNPPTEEAPGDLQPAGTGCGCNGASGGSLAALWVLLAAASAMRRSRRRE